MTLGPVRVMEAGVVVRLLVEEVCIIVIKIHVVCLCVAIGYNVRLYIVL